MIYVVHNKVPEETLEKEIEPDTEESVELPSVTFQLAPVGRPISLNFTVYLLDVGGNKTPPPPPPLLPLLPLLHDLDEKVMDWEVPACRVPEDGEGV